METFQAAPLKILDVSVLVIFGGAHFEDKPPAERRQLFTALRQLNAGSDIVLVWEDAAGRMKFICPPQQIRFFEIMKFDQLSAQIDRTLPVKPA